MPIVSYRHLRITNEILGVGLAVFRFCCVGAPPPGRPPGCRLWCARAVNGWSVLLHKSALSMAGLSKGG